ncbi:uncharacterized protein RJT20DRAFT_125361 [Scheffersomyces xylosifermentans]|uniref:uncharacterized protein n=1 Tax=Scheffersomyces xylosifermentans TaxID=1304137 RepID=UPI00315C64FC
MGSMSTARGTANSKVVVFVLKYFCQRIAKPTLRAFIFAYLYVVIPKALNHIISSIAKKDYNAIVKGIVEILRKALHPKKFPMFAANLVAGINILEPLVYSLLKRYGVTRPAKNLFLSTLVSSFISAVIAFPAYQNHMVNIGRYFSLDLTLLLATRAMDTAISSSLAGYAPASLAKHGDAALFIASSSLIMFAWFYNPKSLPPAYSKWITAAAKMDDELVDALRAVRDGDLKYGEHGPHEDILAPMMERYGKPKEKGNFVVNQPMDCELVHAFTTKNCELHALWRFSRGFVFALKLYGPLNALMLLLPMKGVNMRSRVLRALKSTVRSSAFLGAFISLYWYAVCLTRTRLFPKIFPSTPRTYWDNTIGPAMGAILCGFSSLIETAQRRKELALFVAPRALGTLVPSEPSAKNLRIETLVFSLSVAVLVAFSKKDPKSVRGIFGKGFKQIFDVDLYR